MEWGIGEVVNGQALSLASVWEGQLERAMAPARHWPRWILVYGSQYVTIYSMSAGILPEQINLAVLALG